MKTKVVVGALAMLALAQLAVLGYRSATAAPTGRWISVVDDLSAIQVTDTRGLQRSLASGEPSLVLVFHSECGHCARVAPEWRDWLDQAGPSRRALALSSESMVSARAYAQEKGWDVPVVTVDAGRLGSPAHALTSRTPWVFALDRDGRVLAEGHGIRLDEIAAALSTPSNPPE